MSKKAIFLLPFILVIIPSCKKSSNSTSSSGGGSAPQNTTISNGFPTSGTGSINGVLYAQKITVTNYSITQYQAGATFNSTARPFSYIYTVFGILIGGNQAGVLKLDSTTLKYNTTNTNGNMNTYTDTTNNSVYNSVNWSIGGNANFSAFTTSVPRGYPVIANTSYLPTTFSKSQPLTLTFGNNNYSNTDSIMVMITDYTSSTMVYKYLPGNSASVTFTAAQLSGLSTTSNGEILVYAKNFSNLTNSGKNYIFILENTLAQFVTITP